MKSICINIRVFVLALSATFGILLNVQPLLAQGCNQVEIEYDQPACFSNSRPPTGVSNDKPCTSITVCEDELYTYSAAGGPWSSYLWAIVSGPASPGISPTATSASVNITWPVQGTYLLTLTVTDGSGNTFAKCLEVTVRERPVAGFTFAPNNACAGSVVNFTNNTVFSGTPFYSWDFGDPASGANNLSNLANPTHIYNTSGSYTVTLIAYSSILVPGGGGAHGDSLTLVTCCADTFQQTVTVVNGNVQIECISTVCAGAIAKYTAVGCVSPTWGTPVGGTIISTSGNTVTIQWGNGVPQGQLSVSCGGCTAYATIPIVPASPVINGTTAPCNSSTSIYTLPHLPGTFYTWTLTDVSAAANANNLLSTYPDNNVALINWSLATPGDTYQLTVALNNPHLCCSSSASLTIIPKDKFAIFSAPTVCEGSTTSFFPGPSGNFNWTTVPPTGVSPATTTNTPSYTATFSTAGNYVVTATDVAAAFCNTTASVTISVIPVPAPGSIQGPVTGCVGSIYAYNMSTPAPSGYYYEWVVTSGTFQPIATTTTTGNSVSVQWSSLPGVIIVALKQNSSPFCIIPADTIIVSAALPGSVAGITSVCVDGTDTYTLTGGTLPSGTTINWTITPASLGTIVLGQGSNSISVLWHGQTGTGPWGPATISASTGCGNATPLGGIMVYPKFSVSIATAGLDVCQTGGMALTANGAPGGASYLWTPGGATTQSISGITLPGTYSVLATAGGCNASASIDIPAPFAIIPVTCGVGFCNGLNTNEVLGVQVLKPASGTFTYEWHSGTCTSMGPILATTTNTSLSNSYTATADGNYCVVVKYGTCQLCVNFVVKKVCCPDVNTPSITKTQVTCNQYTFTGNTPNPSGATITWSFGDGSTAAGVSGVPISHTYANAGIYCVTFCVGAPAINPTGCTGNCAAVQAVVPIAASFTYKMGCNGCLSVTNTSSVFGNPAFVTYSWNFGDATTSTLQHPPPHCYTTSGTYNVVLTVTYNDGTINCTKTASQTVVFTPLAITANAPVCTGVPVAFSSTPGGFITYTWDFGDGFTGYISPIVHSYDTAGPYTVHLSVTDALGNLCKDSTLFNVLPGVSNCNILPAYICPGSAATLMAPSGTYTYLWEVETSPNVFVPAPGTNNTSMYSTTVPGNYHVIITSANGCFCTSNKVAVTAVAKPKATFSISPSKNLCGPGTVTLSAPFISGHTYKWFMNGIYGIPISTGSIHFATIGVTTTFNLVLTNQYGCRDTCSMTVTVNNPPAPPVISNTGSCAGVPITLSVTNYASNITWNTGATATSIVVYNAGTYVATYTDPTTGCTSSSSATVNRRPEAGLFPHFCDSIPCKCSRPYVIYAPNPLVGLFASNYTINWYNANTNAFLATGNTYNNGGLGAQTGSYYIIITDQTTGCKDTSDRYSVVVPNCDTCSCSESAWGEMILTRGTNPPNNSNSFSTVCKGEYKIECNKPYTLSTSYNCKDTACKGKVTYSLTPPTGTAIVGTGTVSFTPTQSGTYILTLYGWCGNKPCDSCVIKFTVVCDCDCKSSKWDDVVLTQVSDPVTPTAIITPPLTLSCKKTYAIECNKPYSINATYLCKDSTCKGKVTYLLLPPTGPATAGSGTVNFTPSQTGTYVLTLYGWCGDKVCDSCIIKFTVVCGCDCAGSKWGAIVLTQPVLGDNPAAAAVTPPQTLKCNNTYTLECTKPYSINAAFICKDTACKGKVTYSLQPPSGAAITGSAPLTFTPTQTGTYVLTLYGWCGGKVCDSCVIKLKVDCDCDCKGSKWGDKTITTGTTTSALACKPYDWQCNQTFVINANYKCAKGFCADTTTYKLIPAVGTPFTGNLPLTYTPTVTGTYTLIIYGYCGNKVCDSCVSTFRVECKDTCCKYPFKITPATPVYTLSPTGNATIASETFTITGLAAASLTEVRAEVLSYDIGSNFNNECMACKAYPFLWSSISSAGNIGTVPALISLYGGATTSLFNPTGAAMYQNPREVIWNNGSIFSVSSPVNIKFILPPPSVIDCCELRGKICVKFTIRDANCNECETIVCFDVIIKK